MTSVEQEKQGYRRSISMQRDRQSPAEADIVVLEHLVRCGDYANAKLRAVSLLGLFPSNPFILKTLAVLNIHGGKPADAIPLLRRALQCAPEDPELYCNLGICEFSCGESADALATFRAGLQMAPGNPALHSNYSHALCQLGRAQEAITAAHTFAAAAPGSPQAMAVLGAAYKAAGRYDQAAPCLAKAIELLDHDDIDILLSLAETFIHLRRHSAAQEIYRQLQNNYTIDDSALAYFVFCCLQTCSWESLQEQFDSLRHFIKEEWAQLHPFSCLGVPGLTPEDHRAVAERYANSIVSALPEDSLVVATLNPSRTKRRRIGYISGDFHSHATSYLAVGVFESHNREGFEVFAYSTGPDDGSPMRQRVIRSFDVFRDIRDYSDYDAARLIRNDGIEILIDLKGWTEYSRLAILAYRPAPIQVTWLGYPGTTGSRQLADYLIGDPTVTPPAHADHYAETLALMPISYQPNDSQRTMGRVVSRPEAGLPEGAVVFCSFNQSYKITPVVFELWCQVLSAVPGSILWLVEPNENIAAENLRKEAEARGISAGRLIFAPRLGFSDHLGRLGLADLALDTFPYNSHTTASDALWAGVPMVTLIGDSFPGRVGAGLLKAVGLNEFIADDFDEYIRIATTYAKAVEWQHETKQKLLRARQNSPLFNTKEFTRSLERLYAKMIEHHVAVNLDHVISISDQLEFR